jgi:hypothetical protein
MLNVTGGGVGDLLSLSFNIGAKRRSTRAMLGPSCRKAAGTLPADLYLAEGMLLFSTGVCPWSLNDR